MDISNNLIENAIRPFAVGRKNWLFCDTPRGADASAIVYTQAETAKVNGLDSYFYLRLLLIELSDTQPGRFGCVPALETQNPSYLR